MDTWLSFFVVVVLILLCLAKNSPYRPGWTRTDSEFHPPLSPTNRIVQTVDLFLFCFSFFVVCWQPVVWLWTSPRRRVNAWSLLRGLCTGIGCCRIAAVWFLRVRIICLHLSWSSSGCLDRPVCKCEWGSWSKVKSLEEQRQISWSVLLSCESLWEVWGFHQFWFMINSEPY